MRSGAIPTSRRQRGGYAWKITLREDLKWDDGTPIDATDFVYTMEQQLDPLFRNMRASTYYQNIQIKGARDRVYSGFSGWTEARGSRGTYSEDLGLFARVHARQFEGEC